MLSMIGYFLVESKSKGFEHHAVDVGRAVGCFDDKGLRWLPPHFLELGHIFCEYQGSIVTLPAESRTTVFGTRSMRE